MEKRESLKEITKVSDIATPYTQLTGLLSKGQEVLNAVTYTNAGLLGDPIVALSARNVTTSLVDLIQVLNNKAGEDIKSLGTFVGDTFKKYMNGSINEEVATAAINLSKFYIEAYSPGMTKAMGKIKYRGACRACGFKIPIYPGKYPRFCPQCSAQIDLSTLHIESQKKICPKCKKIYSDSFNECKECDESLFLLSEDLTEVKTALCEVFYLIKATSKEGESIYENEELYKFLNDRKIPVRRKTIIDAFGENISIVTEILRFCILDSYEMGSDLTDEKITESLSKLDENTLSVMFPFVRILDRNKISGIFEGLYSDILERIYDVRIVVKRLITREPLFSEDFEEFADLLESLYCGLIRNITIKEDSTYYANYVEEIYKEHITNIREEVKQRKSLRFALRVLSGDKFNIESAIKSYSTCLSRVVIEYEKSKNPSLKVLEQEVFDNMRKLFTGRYEEAVNFIKGVFL